MRTVAYNREELASLRQLRERFLRSEPAREGGYWTSTDELALYDRTFGERIGWKWDAVLRELSLRGWRPQSARLIDWGCGSGVAARRVLRAWPGTFLTVALHDRSRAAVEFARGSIERAFPEVKVVGADAPGTGCLVAISHVVNELSDSALGELLRWLEREADEVLWVEAGTHEHSRRSHHGSP